MKVVITGARGLLGWHAHARLHAVNCAAKFHGKSSVYDIVALGHADFDDSAALQAAVTGADAVLHFAGVNRAPDAEVEAANPAIAQRLVDACQIAGSTPHVVYANTIHMDRDTPYGRGKKRAADVFEEAAGPFTNLVLPNIFGEGARPFYNNVTATFIDRVLAGEPPEVNPDGRIGLMHSGAAAQLAIDALDGQGGVITPDARDISVPDLLAKIEAFHALYQANIYPDLGDAFDVALFNSYRHATYPDGWPRPLKLNTDARGTLFEAVKGGGGGQTFLSTTEPGVTRGDHYHLNKVERFLVIGGEAIIRIRRVLSDEVWEYRVSGEAPAPVGMPVLHTHSIENVGDAPLLTLFWTHDLFDPANPDTFADKVLP